MKKNISGSFIKVGAFTTFLFTGGAYAFTCPDSNNPEVVSVDCTQMLIRSDKSSITVNTGVTVSDGGLGSIYGPVRLVYDGIGVFVGAFTNNGTIGNTNANLTTIEIANGSGISHFINNGTIDAALVSGGFAALKVYGSIGQLTNAGSITGSGGGAGVMVVNGGYIGAIQNASGASIGSVAGKGIVIDGTIFSNQTRIGSIDNLGLIQGISVSSNASLGSLNTLQNGLDYDGNLPVNYGVVIYSPSSYGKTTFSNVAGSPMSFNIAPGSTLPSGTATYADVLIGISASNLSATSGVYGGGIVSTPWALTNSGFNWSLTKDPITAPVAPNVPRSRAATSQAKAITQAYSAAFAGSPTPALASGVTLVNAVQALTTTQVDQLTNAHAEGYSSNMTIGLEQMAHITNSVMDRIHAPMSSSPTTKVYQDDQGRYIWADAAAVRGVVNNNNNLAGFGYNLYDLIIGGDINRSKDGGYGVYAGIGGTSMVESQQVSQSFGTTNFYTGLYGAHNFSEHVKLSGALGYMYGNTNATRNTPNIGLFTGGNATSNYSTNGVYGAAKLAKAYQLNNVTISPFIGASYSQLWSGKASEQGGNDFNFVIGASTAYTAVTFAGFDFVYPLIKGVKDPLSVVGFYKFGYDWFANSNAAHSITATSPIYGSFTQVGANMGPISNLFALGLQGQFTEGVSARVGVVAAANTYGNQIGGGAEIRVKF